MIHQCATEEDVIQWLMAFGAGYRAEGMQDENAACAKICDHWATQNHVYVNGAIVCARDIRARVLPQPEVLEIPAFLRKNKD